MVDFRAFTDRNVRVVKIEETQILDEQFARSVGERLGKIVSKMTEANLLINMAKVKFMASSMIGQLVVIRESCRRRDITLALCNLNSNISEALQITNITQIIDIYPDEKAGIDAMAENE